MRVQSYCLQILVHKYSVSESFNIQFELGKVSCSVTKFFRVLGLRDLTLSSRVAREVFQSLIVLFFRLIKFSEIVLWIKKNQEALYFLNLEFWFVKFYRSSVGDFHWSKSADSNNLFRWKSAHMQKFYLSLFQFLLVSLFSTQSCFSFNHR